MIFTLPPLGYSYDALEPYIDAKTMEIHYTKHHQAYVDHLNAAIKTHPELDKMSLLELLSDLNTLPEDVRTTIKNNGGGHLNHSMFWKMLKKDGGEPVGRVKDEIKKRLAIMLNLKKNLQLQPKPVSEAVGHGCL